MPEGLSKNFGFGTSTHKIDPFLDFGKPVYAWKLTRQNSKRDISFAFLLKSWFLKGTADNPCIWFESAEKFWKWKPSLSNGQMWSTAIMDIG